MQPLHPHNKKILVQYFFEKSPALKKFLKTQSSFRHFFVAEICRCLKYEKKIIHKKVKRLPALSTKLLQSAIKAFFCWLHFFVDCRKVGLNWNYKFMLFFIDETWSNQMKPSASYIFEKKRRKSKVSYRWTKKCESVLRKKKK